MSQTNTILNPCVQVQNKLISSDNPLNQEDKVETYYEQARKERSLISWRRRLIGRVDVHPNPRSKRQSRKMINKCDVPHVGSKRKSDVPPSSELPYYVRRKYVSLVCCCINVCRSQRLSSFQESQALTSVVSLIKPKCLFSMSKKQLTLSF